MSSPDHTPEPSRGSGVPAPPEAHIRACARDEMSGLMEAAARTARILEAVIERIEALERELTAGETYEEWLGEVKAAVEERLEESAQRITATAEWDTGFALRSEELELAQHVSREAENRAQAAELAAQKANRTIIALERELDAMSRRLALAEGRLTVRAAGEAALEVESAPEPSYRAPLDPEPVRAVPGQTRGYYLRVECPKCGKWHAQDGFTPCPRCELPGGAVVRELEGVPNVATRVSFEEARELERDPNEQPDDPPHG